MRDDMDYESLGSSSSGGGGASFPDKNENDDPLCFSVLSYSAPCYFQRHLHASPALLLVHKWCRMMQNLPAFWGIKNTAKEIFTMLWAATATFREEKRKVAQLCFRKKEKKTCSRICLYVSVQLWLRWSLRKNMLIISKLCLPYF